MFSRVNAVASFLNVPRSRLKYWWESGKIPVPIKQGKFAGWTDEDLDKVKSYAGKHRLFTATDSSNPSDEIGEFLILQHGRDKTLEIVRAVLARIEPKECAFDQQAPRKD